MSRPVALDAMGGDRAPRETVAGALLAASVGVPVVLVGDEAVLRAELASQGGDLPIVHAPEVIDMHAHATEVRRRRQASINVAMRLVSDGEAEAAVSMGHSGATMAAALFTLGRVRSIERPAILAEIPSEAASGRVHLIDAGANADVRPQHLVQFARMGAAYAERMSAVTRPRVGLLSIGEEPTKGNQLVLEAYPLLAAAGLEFVGNVEGRDVLADTADVIVTEGFTGNVVLKLAEGEARILFGWIKEALTSSLKARLGALLVKDALKGLAARMDPAEYGAMPLLGVRGPAFIGHGASDRRAVQNALLRAHKMANSGLMDALAALE
ncbi:MAG TPA: phosphate acyltransferase PlsX [Oceanithermus profundus]|uniref:Phosphate acyltransferase n=1 Tax=Oceanithermus profundus TaxID=187137 RepID=A0A7C4V4Y5_9DEIN|nr:phosphate acyltransferase PlsX [Oceanithermus profundus]